MTRKKLAETMYKEILNCLRKDNLQDISLYNELLNHIGYGSGESSLKNNDNKLKIINKFSGKPYYKYVQKALVKDPYPSEFPKLKLKVSGTTEDKSIKLTKMKKELGEKVLKHAKTLMNEINRMV